MNLQQKRHILFPNSFEYSLQTKAWFAQHSVQESDADKLKFNDAIKAMALSGNLAKHDRLWFRGTGIEDNALVSVANPSTASLTVKISTPTWTQYEGYTGEATKGLNWQYIPSTDGVNFLQNDACLWAYCRTNLNTGYAVGSASLTVESSFAPRLAGSYYGSMNDALAHDTLVSSANSFGLFSVVRSGGTIYLYKNGVLQTSEAFASTSLINKTIYELVLNFDGAMFGPYIGNVFASGAGAGSIDQVALYNEINGLATSFGKNV